MPLFAPVIRKTLPSSLPMSPSSLMICMAVGRASPGPSVLSCAASYLPVMVPVEDVQAGADSKVRRCMQGNQAGAISLRYATGTKDGFQGTGSFP